MHITKVMSIILAVSFLSVSLPLAAAEPALATTVQPRWHLICDSETGCTYWSDGKGQAEENKTGPNIYPTTIWIKTLALSVSDSDGSDLSLLCTWQWKLIGGVWKWVCA